MFGKQYIVKQGDTLWDIAEAHLGDPYLWPTIYDHNNTPSISSITGTRIADPDIIFVGQTIYIPVAVEAPASSSPPTVKSPVSMAAPKTPKPQKSFGGTGRTPPKTKFRSIPFKYDLEGLPEITVNTPAFEATVSLKGSITIQSLNAVDFANISLEQFEINAEKETDTIFGKLINDSKIGYNEKTNSVSFECALTIHSDQPHGLSTTLAWAMGTENLLPMPILKASIETPSLSGVIDNHLFEVSGLQVEIEIKPKLRKKPPSDPLTPLPYATVPVPEPSYDWVYGTGLIVGAIALGVATIAEDIATLGWGVADDVPSFILARQMFSSGVRMMTVPSSGLRMMTVP